MTDGWLLLLMFGLGSLVGGQTVILVHLLVNRSRGRRPGHGIIRLTPARRRELLADEAREESWLVH
jgi:hypothetical protein